MNTKALLATLVVIGSSTVALADPIGFRGDAQVNANVAVRDHRDVDGQYMRDRGHGRRLPVWSVVSSQDSLRSGKLSIATGVAPMYSTLKLEATAGKLQINRVVIKFANGESQVITPNTQLAQGAALTIDLDGATQRHIQKIQVFGQGNRRSSFEILGAA